MRGRTELPERQLNQLTRDELKKAGRADFWRELSPDSRLSDEPFAELGELYQVSTQEVKRLRAQLLSEGYFQSTPLIPKEETEKLASMVSTVVARGFPPLFSMVYDDFWRLIARLEYLIVPLVGSEFKIVPDFWVWRVDGSSGKGGWVAHRDHECDHPFDEQGRPNLVTAWIALTEATLENACMYVLPTCHDAYLPDQVANYSVPPGAEHHIRALPAQPGSVLGWNQHLLHWGSAYRSGPPRVSLGIYLQRANAGPALTAAPAFRPKGRLGFDERLGMVGRMLVKYRHYGFSQELESFSRQAWGFWQALRLR
jgi:hypothetical protein